MQVRLVRIPDQKEGGSATARQDESRPPKVLVHCYSQTDDYFLVSYLEKDSGIVTTMEDESLSCSNSLRTNPGVTKQQHLLRVSADDLDPKSTSAQFYPVLECLMERADQAAAATNQLLRSEGTKQIVSQARKVLEEGATKAGEMWQNQPQNMAKAVTPELENNLKEVMAMVKDEELTVLLERCKTRLESLVYTDIPNSTQQALAENGIRVEYDASYLTESMDSSRKLALEALQNLLAQVELDDFDKVRQDVLQNFTLAFDSLSKAAKSDRNLNDLFETVINKTTVWQEATGRLMSTRSASLFLEGASRFQARAAAIFQRVQFQGIGEIGTKLTKSFTEGDAALAKLKSIELGEVVRTRLVAAIEVRSEALGGLDGIIAGALSSVKSTGKSTQISDLLTMLQTSASSTATKAHETLISVLSRQSTYRDIALMRIEQALCDLGDHIGDDISPEDFAALVRGDGGTAKIFEPIAKRAMQQIESQLDAAELQVSDDTVLGVLRRVRKLMSGDMTMDAILDEVVEAMNDEKVVAAGETILQNGELVLDALEGVSANEAANEALLIAEKAGITKESVIREFERLNVDELLDAASEAVADEKARRKLVSSATDAALDFVLRILPSMPVPPFDGVKDGLLYSISNLSMKGFKVRKENIHIEIAGMTATKRQSSYRRPKTAMPHHSTGGNSRKVNQMDSTSSAEEETETQDTGGVKATELLIIDIRNISAILDKTQWSFEQTYLPYLKGNGAANARLFGGSIRLQFELRKKRQDDESWQPVLCLHDRKCLIEDVELTLDSQSSMAWVLNKLAAIFRGPLRDYVVATILNVLSSKSGWLLERFNAALSPYWNLIMRTANLCMVSQLIGLLCLADPLYQDDLVEADEDVITTETKDLRPAIIELVWRERVPLGMNLLLNDESGLLKVVDFPRGSQARIVCEKRGFSPKAFEGASIVTVNGSSYYDEEELFEALKDPSRPKSVGFVLADSEEAERLRKFVNGDGAKRSEQDDASSSRQFSLRKASFQDEEELGLDFGGTPCGSGLVLKGFKNGEAGTVLAAERRGDLRPGDILTHINDEVVWSKANQPELSTVKLLQAKASHRPLSLTFSSPFIYNVLIENPVSRQSANIHRNGGPEELVLDEKSILGKRRVFLKAFGCVSGVAEDSGILIGDHLVFVNGEPVGAGCRWMGLARIPSLKETIAMLSDDNNYPIGLTFARATQMASRWVSSNELSDADATTICVTADTYERLGCVLDIENTTDIVVSDFQEVPGTFQQKLRCIQNEIGGVNYAIESIDDQFVPSYATKIMVHNAITRSWNMHGSVKLTLCDDELREWLETQV